MHVEALQAREGDCLLLYWDGKVAVIDGGPLAIYREAIAPRLAELRRQRGLQDHEQLLIDLVLVSHVDSDHIGGLVAWMSELVQADEDGNPTTTIDRLWFNSFQDIVGHDISDRVVAEAKANPGPTDHVAARRAVIASVDQGRKLSDYGQRLGVRRNVDFGGDLITAAMPGEPARILAIGGLTVAILAPRMDSVINLQQAWLALSPAVRQAGARVAAYDDDSIYNLSSIACLVEHGQTTALLTGDALGADILEALTYVHLLNPTLHVNILKLPHHGSLHSVDTDFFQQITADHYIVSGNGRHGNPHLDTLDMLVASRPDDDFTVHLTYRDTGTDGHPERIAGWIAEQRSAGRSFTIATAVSPGPGLTPRIRI